ncbi:PhzF family phenazine biosynthesis protein [Acidisphaera sp. L21]|uniref:PhzF family phenazine biosynthesis protein n=1 Tax=Acidisphaera sp. L21 TaxID=1641851 RepID=UPI002110C61E|nr:PhzF family phenazine biosynthesis protein [Acidisphaera sp. L21]
MTAAQMQAIAREFNSIESTFVLPPADPAHTARIRIFSPTRKIPFAGHPNIGTAFVLPRETPTRGQRAVRAQTRPCGSADVALRRWRAL